MSAVSGTSANNFAEVQEIQFQVLRNVSCVSCVGEPNPRTVTKKQQVNIDWALHNGLRPLFIDCSCLLLGVFGSVLAPLMLTCVTCQNWFKENLLRSVGRPFCVQEFLPLFCDARFDLTVKTCR